MDTMRLWVSVLLGCVSCGASGGKPVERPAPRVAPVAETSEVERHPYAELVEPAAPSAAVSPGAWLQIGNAARLVSLLPSQVQAQPSLQPFRDVTTLARGALGADIASVIDLAQPLDVAVSIPQPHQEPALVVAFRLRAPDAIERGQAGLTLRRVVPGMWLIGDRSSPALEGPAPPSDDEGEDEAEEDRGELPESEPSSPPLTCVLAHAGAPVGFRVLCGARLENVQRAAPFLLRELPRSTADVQLELGGPAYRALIEQGVATVKAKAEGPMEAQSSGEKFGEQVGLAIVETLGAHERVSLSLRLGSAGAELQLDVAFPDSPLTQGLQRWALSAQKQRLPGSFGLLPSDHGLAFSFVGLGQDTTRSFLSTALGTIMTDTAQEFVVPASQQRELIEAFRGIVPADAHVSLAMGADVDAIEAALTSRAVVQADSARTPLTAASIKALQEAFGGWVTIGLDVSPKPYLAAVERLLRADALPMRRRAGMPRKSSEREDSDLVRRPVSTRGLPSGTIHVLEKVRPAKTYLSTFDKPPILPYDAHWLVVPDGPRVWIVIARSEAGAGARALALLRRDHRLAQLPDVQQAIEQPLLGAWHYSMAGMRLQSLDFDSALQRDISRTHLQIFRKLLRQAKTPMLMTIEAVPLSTPGAGFGLRGKLHVNQTALTELFEAYALSLAELP